MHFPETFEAFLAEQQIDSATLTPDVELIWRDNYERAKTAVREHDPGALFRAPCRAGEFRYAVAIEDGTDLWLTLAVQRSKSGCYVLISRDSSPWNPHASYHTSGRYHHKSHDLMLLPPQQRQPLDHFTGTEHLGAYYGHGVGTAVCRPEAFTSVLTVPTGILEGTRGCVLVDLVAPGAVPAAHHRNLPGLRIVKEETYRDYTPWVVVAVAAQDDPS